jgi:hypothetical protein
MKKRCMEAEKQLGPSADLVIQPSDEREETTLDLSLNGLRVCIASISPTH